MVCSNLEHEEAIVWLDDIEKYDYVRPIDQMVAHRKGLPKKKHYFKTVGYADLKPSAKSTNGCFFKRIFYVMPHDRSENPEGVYRRGCPCEAVDPRTVAPGVSGECNDRVSGDIVG